MRFCLIERKGGSGPTLAVEREGGVLPIDAPPSLRQALDRLGTEGLRGMARSAKGKPIPLDQVTRWCPPVPDPRTFRDFYAFEQHVKAARARRGQDMVPTWYEIPVFYFSNTGSLKGHQEPVHKPESTRELDFELELGFIIGTETRDATGPGAEEAIFGFLVLNDWSARDLQREEMKCMLGPAKGKDFATSIGPWVVTLDELADVRERQGIYNLAMTARRNGREISRSNANTLHYDVTKMVERASRDVTLFPGDLIGSGTCGTGCILELGPENVGGWLQPGDRIELEIERLGVLATPIC